MTIADLHIHSKYSRATSRECDAPHLDFWARCKGIGLVGTGDFTHPVWRCELAEMLIPAEDGLYRLRDELVLPHHIAGEVPTPRFVFSAEISTIYKKNGKTRKVHHVILVPSLEAAETLSHRLEAIGNLKSDGRPILGLDSHDLLEITLESCPDAIYIPAHIWTPHFSLFGAFSGFDTLEECYGDLSGHVHALETGLSSDPPMNRLISSLDGYTLVSNSDAHSPSKLGREANLLTCELSYPALRRAIQTGEGFGGTLEFFPEEGKYHLDGHRACDCCLEPAQTKALEGRCPVCGRKLTIGVLHRVEELADRTEPSALPQGKPFESLIPLPELLADCLGVSASSKKVEAVYFELLKRLGPEFHILRELSPEDAERSAGLAVGEGLRRLRAGRVIRKAGYDGEYGVISLFEPHELELLSGQTSFVNLADLAKTAKRAKEMPAVGNATASSPTPAVSAPIPSADRLNDHQAQAVEATDPAIAVIAGPGTGKTKTLVSRIAYMIEVRGVSPAEITAVTFTNQAAEEMRQRLEDRLGGKKAIRGLTVGTFHAICLRLLDRKPLIDRSMALTLAQAVAEEYGEKISPSDLLQRVSAAKNGLSIPSSAQLPPAMYETYCSRLRELHLRDLDDLLLDALDSEAHGRGFTHLLVDEFQDINALQRRLVRHWSERGKSLFVIGDPDQSIYGFRGANAACFDELAADLPSLRIISLTQNYRSTPEILSAALSVISHNPGWERTLVPNCAAGTPVRTISAPDGFSEAVWIAKEIARMAGGVDMLDAQAAGNDRSVTRSFSEIAVLCRTRRQLEQMEICLRHDSIPCVISGREDFLADSAVQGLLGFFRSLLDPCDVLSLRTALTALWRCPVALSDQCAAVLKEVQPLQIEELHARLSEYEVLRPWMGTVALLWPRLHKDKPRKLLETLAQAVQKKGKPVEKLLNTAVFHSDLASFLQAMTLGEESDIRRASGNAYASGAVRLMTLHGSKGLEFPVVFLAGVTQGVFPSQRANEETDLEEERRLYFVGITRAREELILSCAGTPSVFWSELPGDVQRQTVRARNRLPQSEQLRLF